MSEVHNTIVIVLACISALMFLMPILSAVPWLKDRISYSWCVVSVTVCMGLGCIIDLNHLSDEIKQVVITGGFVLAGLYMIFKFLTNFVRQGGFTTQIQKGDLKLKLDTKEVKHVNTNEYSNTNPNIISYNENEDISRSFDSPCLEEFHIKGEHHGRKS